MKRFKDFSIKTKFMVAFTIIGTLIATVALIFTYLFVTATLDKTENYWLEKAFYSLQTIINIKLDNLLSIAKDYANWDDMYNYIDTHDKKWVSINVTDWIPKNFKVDLILIFDAAGKLLYQFGNFEEFQIDKDLSSHPLIKQAFKSRETEGFYFTSKGMVFIASSQIMHTDESGPRNGTYLYGRLINKDSLEEIKKLTGIELSIINKEEVMHSTIVGHVDRPKDFEDIYNELAAKKFRQFNIYKPSYQYAFIYTILKDIKGEGIGMFELIRPRGDITAFRGSFIKISIWVFILIILLVSITVVVITTLFLKPLDILKRTIEEIQKTKDMLKRVKIERQDEIGILARDFNIMMDALNKSRSELMEAQQNLIKSEKMATAAELAMGTVHQINNPLSIAIGRLQMLRRLIGYKTHIPESDLDKDLNIIEEQTRRAVEITNSLLCYAMPITLRFEKCNINELLQDIIDLIKERLENENINIVENLKPDLPSLQYCDTGQMQDVFMNIIANAQQSMSAGGRLEISTDYDEKQDLVCIKFTDNGSGIPPENIKKLFTPFFSTKADKSGLGLAVSYNIVKAHQGRIEVESEVGKGSTFAVKIPIGRA